MTFKVFKTIRCLLGLTTLALCLTTASLVNAGVTGQWIWMAAQSAENGRLLISDHNQGVWRVFYDASDEPAVPKLVPARPKRTTDQRQLAQQIIHLPQPGGEYTRVLQDELLQSLENRDRILQTAVLERRLSVRQRLRALRILTQEYEKLSADFVASLARSRVAELRAQAAWIHGIRHDGSALSQVLTLLEDQGHTLDPAKSTTHFNILDENTGKPLFTTTQLRGSPQFFLVEDRLLYTPDAAHWKKIRWQFFTLDPQDFRPLGQPWTVPHDNTTAYEVFMELPYVNGRFLMRTWQGQVVCYDLRVAAKED